MTARNVPALERIIRLGGVVSYCDLAASSVVVDGQEQGAVCGAVFIDVLKACSCDRCNRYSFRRMMESNKIWIELLSIGNRDETFRSSVSSAWQDFCLGWPPAEFPPHQQSCGLFKRAKNNTRHGRSSVGHYGTIIHRNQSVLPPPIEEGEP